MTILLHKNRIGNILEKKLDFKTICFKKNQKILRRNAKRKITKHRKKKNDTDGI